MRLLQLLLFICLLLGTPPQVCGFLPANRRATTASPRSFAPVRTTSFVRRDEACPSWLATSTSAEGCLENPDNEPRRIRHNHILARGYRKYLDLCVTRPWPTKAVSGGVVAGLGAILSQGMAAAGAGVPLTINWHQLQSFALAGLLFEGPYMHWWYEQLWRMGRWLEAQKGIQALNSRFLTMAQILVDQTIGVAIFFPAYFYAYEIAQSMVLLRAPELSLVGFRMTAELLNVIRTNYLVWPLASYLIFRRVPEALRVLASNLVAIFWNAYLCSRIA